MPARRPGLKIVPRAGTATLYVRGTVRGERIFESTGTADPRLADEYRANRENEAYRESIHGPKQQQVAFAEAVLSYLRAEPRSISTKSRLAKLLRYLGPKITCDQVDQVRADKAADAILRPGYAPATKLREITTPLRAVLAHAARRRWCAVPVLEATAPSIKRVDWFTPAQAEALIANAAPHLAPLLVFLFGSGARVSEALSLRWVDVDLGEGRAVLRETKGPIGRKRDRLVLLPPRLIATLAAMEGRDGKVFRRSDGKPYADKQRVGGGQIKTAWATACLGAGIAGGSTLHQRPDRPGNRTRFVPHMTPHHCRHSYASWHYAMHRDLLLLRTEGGWETVSQVERYAHLVPPGLVPAIKAFLGMAPVMPTRTKKAQPGSGANVVQKRRSVSARPTKATA